MPSFTGMLPRYTLGPGHDKGRKGGKVLLEDERCGIMSFVEVREGSTKLGSTKAPIPYNALRSKVEPCSFVSTRHL